MALVFFITGLKPLWFCIPAIVLIAGLLIKPVLKTVLMVWLKFSNLLGKINSTIILSIIYFLIITPYAIVFRKKMGGNYIKYKPLQGVSLFKDRSHIVSEQDFEKSW